MKKFMKFGLIGILNTLLTIGSYMLFVYLGMNYIIANVIGYGIGVINSYYWNKNWVFQVSSNQRSIFVKFVVVNLITLVINTLALYILANYLDIHPYLAQIFATGFGLLINFFLNKKWTFEK